MVTTATVAVTTETTVFTITVTIATTLITELVVTRYLQKLLQFQLAVLQTELNNIVKSWWKYHNFAV